MTSIVIVFYYEYLYVHLSTYGSVKCGIYTWKEESREEVKRTKSDIRVLYMFRSERLRRPSISNHLGINICIMKSMLLSLANSSRIE